MPVNPIDYGRYGHKEMIAIFEEEHRHALWLRIEAVVAKVQAEMGIMSFEAADDIERTARPEIVTLQRTMEIESQTRHDIAALFEAISEKCDGPGARWVHFGLTSNDVKDTGLAMQMCDAFDVLIPQIDKLCAALAERCNETVDLIAVGRSHGQHAVPITYGLRFAVWLNELLRHRERVLAARERAMVGKIAGATGSHAALGPLGIEIQKQVLTRLGLRTPIATTQIVQRDRHAEVIMVLAGLAATIDKIATDLRSLQRSEIGETFEPFDRKRQVGSSAMPHKRNPVTCEKICGIARYVRSHVQPALENVISWEERDISHSSTERFIIPESFILVDYIVREMTRVIAGLEIDESNVKRNLENALDKILSEYIITVLTKAGLERPKAHEKLRQLSIVSRDTGVRLIELVNGDEELSGLIKGRLDVKDYFESIREVSRIIVQETLDRYHAIESNGK